MAIEFQVPDLGEGVENAEVSRIYVSQDDTIEADEDVMELESEKAVIDLPCPHAGRITKIHVAEGDTIEVGQNLLTIEADEEEAEEDVPERAGEQEAEEDGDEADEDDADGAEEDGADEADEDGADESEKGGADEEPAKEGDGADETEPEKDETVGKDEATEQEEESDETEAADEEDIVAATIAKVGEEGVGRNGAGRRGRDAEDGEKAPAPAGPSTRRLARELGVDLRSLEPPEGGAILQEDVVRAHLEEEKAAALGGAAELPDFSKLGPVERAKLGEVKRTAAKRLTASWRAIPHVTQHGVADITELEDARQSYLDAHEDAEITLTAIAVAALCSVLKDSPTFNASLDVEAGEIIYKSYYNIGVAVDTERGLIVPVLRDADRKSIREIADEIADLAERARTRQVARKHLEGATFTVSNQGGIGGGHFTPIIDWPQVAILGLGRAAEVLRPVDGTPAPRLELPLSLSYDHRVVNGADAARFIERLATVLSTPRELMMEA